MRRVFITALTIVLALVALAPVASQSMEAMIQTYGKLDTYVGRRDAMAIIAGASDPELKSFFVGEFERVLRARERLLSKQEEVARVQLAQILLEQMGKLKAREAADLVHRFYYEEENHQLKGAAMEALGVMGATEYQPFIVETLTLLNTKPMHVESEEHAVLGAILALEAYADPSGYEPVFYASVGRYAMGVRHRATEALQRIASDPTEIIGEILEGDLTRLERYYALKALSDSDAPRESKIAIATRALERTLEETIRNMMVEEKKSRIRLRTQGLEMLITNEAQNPEAVEILTELALSSDDLNNRLLSLSALGVNATEKAVTWLSDYLADLNTRQALGDASIDTRVVRATIRAAGETEDPAIAPELFRVKFSGYGTGVVREADLALEQVSPETTGGQGNGRVRTIEERQ